MKLRVGPFYLLEEFCSIGLSKYVKKTLQNN